MLPRSEINAIKSNFYNAVSTKNQTVVAVVVELPPLPHITGAPTKSNNSNGGHGEQLKIDGLDWSNVLNPLLDAQEAFREVRDISLDLILLMIGRVPISFVSCEW